MELHDFRHDLIATAIGMAGQFGSPPECLFVRTDLVYGRLTVRVLDSHNAGRDLDSTFLSRTINVGAIDKRIVAEFRRTVQADIRARRAAVESVDAGAAA
jgi:hypothetical protein